MSKTINNFLRAIIAISLCFLIQEEHNNGHYPIPNILVRLVGAHKNQEPGLKLKKLELIKLR